MKRRPNSFNLSLAVVTLACTMMIGCSSTPDKRNLSAEERARLWVEAANGALAEGDPTHALQLLIKAEENEPELPELHHSRALAYYAKHDVNAAIAAAKKAVTLNENYSVAKNTLGKLLMDAGRYREAEKPLLFAAKDTLNSEAYKARINLGILYYRQQDYTRSLDNLDIAIRDNAKQSCIAHFYKGHIFLKKSDLPNAIRSYSKATEKNCATFSDAHLALGVAFERNKQFDRARKKFLDVKQSFPNTKSAEDAAERLRYLP